MRPCNVLAVESNQFEYLDNDHTDLMLDCIFVYVKECIKVWIS